MDDWFFINNIDEYDSPALVIYPERIEKNIALAKEMTGDVTRLRPHVKTNKISEVCAMMMAANISKFKCATIAEAEMLALLKAPDVLLAYQPVGPKMQRLFSLINTYPQTHFSCLVDDENIATQLNDIAQKNKVVLPVFIDLNVGMNRTGIATEKAYPLIKLISTLPSLHLEGLHAYDGHIRDSDIAVRKNNSDAAFQHVENLYWQASQLFQHPLKMVAGGTPTFPIHSQKNNVESSPGTFVFWDWGYQHSLPDERFLYAALLVSRVVSVIDEETICADLGHKSVAAENPFPRVHFLNAPDAVPVSQSEEHLVLKVPLNHRYKTGDVLYGVPVHICPTVALYNNAYVVKKQTIVDSWKVVARDRSITI